MPVKQFSDTSAVSVAYALDSASQASEKTTSSMTFVPFTTEGMAMAKESQASTAIGNDRRTSGSKNTKGTATGSLGLELGYAPFVLDMLQASMMSTWAVDTAAGDGSRYIVDGEIPQFLMLEKRIKGTKANKKYNFMERYYGNLVNEFSIEISSSALATATVNTMAAFADLGGADASTNANAGGLVTTYNTPASYEIADGANSIKKLQLKDSLGVAIEATFADATLSITNNVREQPGLGKEFAAGMAVGKVDVSLSGNIYFVDDTLLKSHMANGNLSAELTIETANGILTFILPKLRAEAPSANAQSQNSDYVLGVNLTAERGAVTLNGASRTCVMAIVEKSK